MLFLWATQITVYTNHKRINTTFAALQKREKRNSNEAYMVPNMELRYLLEQNNHEFRKRISAAKRLKM